MGLSMESTHCNRLLLCCLSICLLWVTTLKAAVELATIYIEVPTFKGASSICKDGYQVTNDEKEKYTRCTTEQISSCNTKFDEYVTAESTRINELQIINNNTLHKYDNISDITNQIVQGYKTTLQETSIIYNDENCSVPQLSGLKSYLSDLTQVYHSAKDYIDDTDGLVISMKLYVTELNNYNTDYYNNQSIESRKVFSALANYSLDEGYISLNDSMNTLLSNMLVDIDNCLGLSNKTMGKACGNSARSAYEDVMQETNAQLTRIQVYNTQVKSTFSEFVTQVSDAMDVVEAFYDAVNDIIEDVDDSLCTKDASWCNFNRIDWQIKIPALPEFPTPFYVPSAMNVWGEGYTRAMSTAKVNLTSTFQTIQTAIDSMKTSISNDLSIVHFDAYQPPSYEGGNISLVVDNHIASSNAYIASLTTNATATEQSSSSSSNTWTKSDSKESSYSTSWMAGRVDLLQFEQIVVYIISLFDNLFIFDYLYRVVHSLHLVKKYWSNSLVSLPMINISNTKGKYQFQDNHYLFAAHQVLCIFPYLYIQVFIVVTLTVLILVSIIKTYIPTYQGYIAGCAQHSSETTYLSEQLLSLAYNYASYYGNIYTKSHIEQYNSDATTMCTTRSTTNQQSYNAFINQLGQYNETIIQNDYYFSLMASCATSSQPLPANVQYMHNISSIPSIESLTQRFQATYAVYNCVDQPTCTVTCAMNQALLQSVTNTCSCNLQWFFHSNILHFVAVILAFCCMNASRLLLLQGIIMLYWRQFAPETFTYKASCDIQGRFITPNIAPPLSPPPLKADYAFMMENPFYANHKVGVTHQEVEKVVGTEINKQMVRYRCKALLCILGSILAIAVLLLPLHYLSGSVNYTS